MSNKTFTTTCPSCGNVIDVTLSEHTCAKAVKTGATKLSANDRLEALRKAGVNVGNLFAMRGASGEDMLVRLQDGKIQQVNDNDPILTWIESNGTIPNNKLYRRWIMAQVFHMLHKTRWNDGNFHQNLKRKGYEYMWDMTVEEFRVQERLYRNDKDNFEARNRFFNKDLAISMCRAYIKDVTKYFNELTTRHCRGVAYKRTHGKDIYVHDFNRKVIEPLERNLRSIMTACTPCQLYDAISAFDANRIKLYYTTPQYKVWQDAFKGVGGYYTMKSLILFHGCRFYNNNHKMLYIGESLSLNHLNAMAIEYQSEGWRMISSLEKMIADNGIDIDRTIKSWQK